MKFVCKNCGKDYDSYKPNSVFCSKECRKKYNNIPYRCDNCGKDIVIYRGEYQKLLDGTIKHKYCSRECANKGQENFMIKTCVVCDKEFRAWASESNRKYCSAECYDTSRKQYKRLSIRICEQCGNKFSTYHKHQKFCSKSCVAESQSTQINCVCSNCGQEFNRRELDVINKTNVFCSKDCEVNFRSWSKEDEDVLNSYYRKISTKDIVPMLSKKYTTKAIKAHATTLGLSQSREWTAHEEQIVKDNYSKVKIDEMKRLLPNRSEASIRSKAHSYGLKSYYYCVRRYTDDEKEYIKNNYLSTTNEELAQHLDRNPHAIEQYLRMHDLFRPFEIQKAGYKSLNKFMRSRLTVWADNVRKDNNYECSITGSHSDIVVHHCRSFNILMEETIEVLNFPIKNNFEDYTDDELNSFSATFMKIQEEYKEYTCVNEEIHRLFHKNYGYGDNDIEQWEEFVTRYKQGHYN